MELPKGVEWAPGEPVIRVGRWTLPVINHEQTRSMWWIEGAMENGARLVFMVSGELTLGSGTRVPARFDVWLACQHRFDSAVPGEIDGPHWLPQPCALHHGRLVHEDGLSDDGYHEDPEVDWLEEYVERVSQAASCQP